MYTAQQERCDLKPESYYKKLWNWAHGDDGTSSPNTNEGWKIINEYLHTFPIVDKHNPAKDSINAPQSSVHEEVIYDSLTNNETAVAEAIEDDRVGFRGGIISSYRVKELTGLNGKRVSKVLSNLNYKKYCRCSKGILQEEGIRPHLWVKKDVTDDIGTIIDRYMIANYNHSPVNPDEIIRT